MLSIFKHLFPSKKTALRNLAKKTNGKYKKRKLVRTGKVIWNYRGFDVELEYENRLVGYYIVSGTRLSFQYTPRSDYEFILHPHSLLDDISEWLGFEHNIKIQDKEFDEHFILQSKDKNLTEKMFKDVSFKYLIECFPHITIRTYNRDIKRRKLAPGHRFLLISYPTPILKDKQLESFYELAIKMIDRMEQNYIV